MGIQCRTGTVKTKTNAEVATPSPAKTAYTPDETGYDVVYIDADTNSVYIDAEPGKTYVIADDEDSYERRLRMFDDPQYTVTINLGWNDPWYYGSMYYPYYYRPWRYYSPFSYYTWGYDPWYSPYYYSYW